MFSSFSALKILVATVFVVALGVWLFAPESTRISWSLASWTSWKQAKNLSLDTAQTTLKNISGALQEYQKNPPTEWWQFSATSSGTTDSDRLAWNQTTLSTLSGAWLDAVKGFAQAAGTGSSLPKDEAFFQLGNALYRLGESKNDEMEKIKIWIGAVTAYGKSLALDYRDTTWENREFVLQKLKEEIQKIQPDQKSSSPGQGGSQGQQPTADDLRSLEQQMRDAARQDQELRKWLRPDGQKPQTPRLPSELLRQLMGGDEGGVGESEKKDW